MWWGLTGAKISVYLLHIQPDAIYYIPILSLQHINNTVEVPWDQLLHFSRFV